MCYKTNSLHQAITGIKIQSDETIVSRLCELKSESAMPTHRVHLLYICLSCIFLYKLGVSIVATLA